MFVRSEHDFSQTNFLLFLLRSLLVCPSQTTTVSMQTRSSRRATGNERKVMITRSTKTSASKVHVVVLTRTPLSTSDVNTQRTSPRQLKRTRSQANGTSRKRAVKQVNESDETEADEDEEDYGKEDSEEEEESEEEESDDSDGDFPPDARAPSKSVKNESSDEENDEETSDRATTQRNDHRRRGRGESDGQIKPRDENAYRLRVRWSLFRLILMANA